MSTTSTGPRSRTRAGRNPVRHGLTALLPVLPGIESEEEWQRHLDGVAKSLLPRTHLEAMLSERIALILWRLRRVARYEREVTLRDHEELHDHCTSRAELLRRAAREQEWRYYQNEESRPLSIPGLVALLEVVPRVPGDPFLTRPAALAVLQALADAAGGPNLQQVLSGAERDLWSDRQWTTRDLEDGMELVAAAAGTHWTDLKPKALLAATARLNEAQAEGELRFHRARLAGLLPRPEVLDSVVRYEAHLNRQLLASLHELEALQARRMGRSAPLARLDVSGIAETAEQ